MTPVAGKAAMSTGCVFPSLGKLLALHARFGNLAMPPLLAHKSRDQSAFDDANADGRAVDGASISALLTVAVLKSPAAK